jgi:hypothetical protein
MKKGRKEEMKGGKEGRTQNTNARMQNINAGLNVCCTKYTFGKMFTVFIFLNILEFFLFLALIVLAHFSSWGMPLKTRKA